MVSLNIHLIKFTKSVKFTKVNNGLMIASKAHIYETATISQNL